jgi:hypothetical protein
MNARIVRIETIPAVYPTMGRFKEGRACGTGAGFQVDVATLKRMKQ